MRGSKKSTCGVDVDKTIYNGYLMRTDRGSTFRDFAVSLGYIPRSVATRRKDMDVLIILLDIIFASFGIGQSDGFQFIISLLLQLFGLGA